MPASQSLAAEPPRRGAEAEPRHQEKCAGTAKAGRNDRGPATSSYAGTAKKDNEIQAWIYLPKGTCEKIASGMVAKKGGM